MDRKNFSIGAFVSVIISIVGYETHQQPVEIFIILFLQWILTFCFELRYPRSASDKLLGDDLAARLREDKALADDIRLLANEAIAARSLKSPLIDQHLDRLLEFARTSFTELAKGTLKVDLGPGGRHLPDLVEVCDRKYQGVSLVNLEEYWHGPIGRESLNKCKKAVENGKIVERIFIERRAQLPALATFVREHQAAGVRCRVAVFEEVDFGLRHDFAIIDDNQAAVQLRIDPDRTWTEADYCVNKNNSSGCARLRELMENWRSLVANSQPAEQFLRSYPDEISLQAVQPRGLAPSGSTTQMRQKS